MKSSDKVLIGIVVGIIILVIVALVITLTRPEPTYIPDDTPKGVVHNYLLALQREDYEKAYGYLSPTVYHYPSSTQQFKTIVEANSYRFRMGTEVSISVDDATISGKNATVEVTESRFYGGDLFDSGQSAYTFSMDLQLKGNDWKIVKSYYYFANCWTNRNSKCY